MAVAAFAAADPKNLPPREREFCSASRRYCLAVRTTDDWRSKHAVAEMRETGAGNRIVWSRVLPQELGPRYALVADTGESVLFDEWINTMSPMAIVVLNRSGAPLRTISFREIQEALAIPADRIVSQAKFGPWMTEPPSLDDRAEVANVRTAGQTLSIRLADGRLSRK